MDPAKVKLLEMLPLQQAQNDVIALGNSDIQQFYNKATIFVTGGTGFLGKLVIEKLFRSCKISKMFLLIRPKKENNVQQRLSEVFTDPLFDILHKDQPDFTRRVVIIDGDLSLSGLGISTEDWITLSEEVSVIFHVASKVKYDEPLSSATLINVRGTREMIRLGHACKHLRSFVYVSTAYSHATLSMVGEVIQEKFYPTFLPPDVLIDLAEKLHEDKMNDICPGLMSGWHNTYTYTKAVAEETVRTLGAGLPICIVRAPVVTNTYMEPTAGWVGETNLHGASGILLGMVLGIDHVFYAKSENKTNFVPADIVNNAIIAAGWECGKRWDNREKEIKIYNVTNNRNSMTYEESVKVVSKCYKEFPTPKAFWYCFTLQVGNHVSHGIFTFLLHTLPAHIVDTILLLLGKKPILTNYYQKSQKLIRLTDFFVMQNWTFNDDNLLNLYNSMSKNDQIIFNNNIKTMPKEDFLIYWCIGLRKYVIKDGLRATEYGLKKQKIFKMISYIVLFICMLILWTMIKFVCFITGVILF